VKAVSSPNDNIIISASRDQRLIVSGSSDKTINVFDAENAGEPIYSLIGHSGNICTLEVTPSNHIISGSWD
ncbi:24835_t:CDS:2, partial [Entrophospora sp. SA101]